ncbi:Fc.00g037520.m01.CDS01 [Cosmosporella sp. VM-42]
MENVDEKEEAWQLSDDGCYVALSRDHLNVQQVMDLVRSPSAGAIVLFAGKHFDPLIPPSLINTLSGTTRDTFADKAVKELQYTSYAPLALRTMLSITKAIRTKYHLQGIAMVHRLGTVPIGEESILIAVSAPHRQAAWRAGEEALEECKARVEVWKREEFEGEEGVWRANRDGAVGRKDEA